MGSLVGSLACGFTIVVGVAGSVGGLAAWLLSVCVMIVVFLLRFVLVNVGLGFILLVLVLSCGCGYSVGWCCCLRLLVCFWCL